MRRTALDKFIEEICREAGSRIQRNFGKVTTGETKSARGDIVTKVDYESEDVLISAIRKKFPYHSILSEEAGSLPGKSEYTWIIDPLDGTSNFASQIPMFCVLVALAKNNVIQASATYDPIHDEFFYARKGQGSYVNGHKIHVSETTEFDQMRLNISNVRLRSSLETFSHWRSVFALYTTYFQRFGSAGLSMAYVACGRSDAYIIGGAYPWDIAAGALLIREAGGKISTLEGLPWQWKDQNQRIVAANPKLHRKLMRQLTQ